jgi:lipopolysaccharide export system protein LptA
MTGDSFTGALARVTGENVGSYAMTQGTLSAGGNYDLTFVGADLTITPRPITLTADAQSKIYGESDPALTYQITVGSLAFNDGLTGALEREAGENVGSYAITAGTLGAGGNYEVTFHGANLEITVRPITVTADAKTKVYGDTDPALTYETTSGSLAFSDTFSGALTRAPGQEVGTYAIQQGTLALSSNYALAFVGADFSITVRPITVTADGKTKVYGDDDPALTYQITDGSLAFSDAFSGALTRAPGQDVGTYPIQQGTLALSTNYSLSYVGANLTIERRPITLTADPKSKVYGDADPGLTYQITSGNLASTDVFTGALTRAAGESVGSYAIGQGTLALTSNYELTYVGANLAITTRQVTVTTDPQSKMYGDADPALTYKMTSGSLAFSDAFTGALARVAGENVGTYAIQQGSLALSTNYTLTFVGADLSITQRPVTVTADVKSKVYGNADPALTYQITSGSLAFSDAFGGTLTRSAGENVGAYAIQQGTLVLSGNYSLTFVGASLTITARPITVTADNKTKYLGAADPPFTYHISSGSLVAGDAFSGTLSRVTGEGIGSYAITQGTLALSTNYELALAPGSTLQIQYAPATVACLGSAGRTIREPINAAGNSVFKQGSTVPAKFRVCDVNGNSIGSPGVVAAFKLANTINGTVGSFSEDVASTTPDAAFRWDSVEQQWIFNISTKPLAKNATYTFQVALNDGTAFQFTFGLR